MKKNLLMLLLCTTMAGRAVTVTLEKLNNEGVTYESDTPTGTAKCYAANENITSAYICAKVEYDGVTYKVTEITEGVSAYTIPFLLSR